jgi:small multidrug resistance family-3 protein
MGDRGELPAALRYHAGAMLIVLRTAALFFLTACAEITGCFLFYECWRQHRSAWLLVPAAVSLGLFAWLLTLHPSAAGRTYAAYGGVYVATAILWLWLVEKQQPDRWDLLGAAVSLLGMAIIAFAPRA